jgi:hypothetical protein
VASALRIKIYAASAPAPTLVKNMHTNTLFCLSLLNPPPPPPVFGCYYALLFKANDRNFVYTVQQAKCVFCVKAGKFIKSYWTATVVFKGTVSRDSVSTETIDI